MKVEYRCVALARLHTEFFNRIIGYLPLTINTSNVSSGSRLCENSNRTQGNLIRPAVREGAWRRWHRVVIDSQLAPAIQFAMRLKKYLRGILASAIYHMNSSILEGVNNKIKVIKRMAYGLHDSAYFFLNIKAASHGNAR